MLELKQAPLMVNRGYSAVLKAAYNLLTDNFKKIFKHIWIYSLILSCVMALYFMFSINTMINSSNAMMISIIPPFVLIAEILFYARALMQLNDQSMKWNSFRVLKFGIVFMVLLIIISIIVGLGGIPFLPKDIENAASLANPQSTFKYTVYICSATLVITLLLIPYIFVYMKYYMEPQTHIRKLLFNGYKTGIKYWGFIFITTLLAGLALFCISVVISLPLIIVYTAFVFSLQGEVNGDEAGIPNYFSAITFAAAAITFFVTTFMTLYTLYISYYLYGSIETREKEKKEITKTVQQ